MKTIKHFYHFESKICWCPRCGGTGKFDSGVYLLLLYRLGNCKRIIVVLPVAVGYSTVTGGKASTRYVELNNIFKQSYRNRHKVGESI